MEKIKQISFWIDKKLYKKFSNKCIELELSKKTVLNKLIREFLKTKSS